MTDNKFIQEIVREALERLTIPESDGYKEILEKV
jgi:uncharacterized protein YlaN (UPF0358 family)